MPSSPTYALSLKQPWAALLVYGRKSIEVRRWPTARRGHILIHAARVSDDRPEAWALVPPELREAAHFVGGFVGAADLTGCIAYRTFEAFVNDQPRHLNLPQWYVRPVMYGFTFQNAEPTSFRPYPGWMRFFPVRDGEEHLPT
jgi:hypothetical protein